MITDQIQDLNAARARVAELEEIVAAQLNQELISLPGKYGFPDINEFIAALRAASGFRRKARVGSTAKKSDSARIERRKRATITDEVRVNVKRLVEEGKTGAEVAQELGISLPSVQNIKKALGLVRQSKVG